MLRLLGKSPTMEPVYEMIRCVASTDTSVLITGESGTGKELVARALHDTGARSKHPFVAINCAAIPENLLESELFGHGRGAFTGAKENHQGLFEQAGYGTIFLDEIGEMKAEMQVKLLRVLQEMCVRPVGGTTQVPLHARVISATNIDLECAIEDGTFREDLFYRLNVVQIHVPPLRTRGSDILLLATQFISESAERNDKVVKGLTPEATQLLLDYDWPGNVRQLQNWMERAVTLSTGPEIGVQDLPHKAKEHQAVPEVHPGAPVDVETLPSLAEVERRYIDQVLFAVDGNKSQAAKILGVNRKTLYRKLDRAD